MCALITYNLSLYDMLLEDDTSQLHTSFGTRLYVLMTCHFYEM